MDGRNVEPDHGLYAGFSRLRALLRRALGCRRLRHHTSRAGLTDEHGRWNGTVRFNEEWLEQPLHWRKPRRIFVCAHSDLFHENVPDEWIDKVLR